MLAKLEENVIEKPKPYAQDDVYRTRLCIFHWVPFSKRFGPEVQTKGVKDFLFDEGG